MTSSVSTAPFSTAWASDVVAPAIRVAVVDDHSLVRASIRRLLGGQLDMEWVGEASDGAEAVELVARTSPDVVLMDLSMPGTDGLTATQQVVSLFTDTRVLVLTTSADPSRFRRSLDAGAAAVVDKDGNPATVLAGIRAVARSAGSTQSA
jgi:DNA-binding NarL/FixJ family response regulator